MLRSTNKNPVRAFCLVLSMGFILLTASCSEPALPTIEQLQSNTSPGQVINIHASIPKISAGQHLRFERISSEQGLSEVTVFCILQDDQGFMWFGTEDGLNKSDGQNFTVYKHDPDNSNSLSDNWIWVIHEDHLRALWIGTLNGGLDRYDRELEQFSHYQHDPDNPQSLSNNEVLAIYEDSDGILWIGTRGGLDRFDRENGIFTHNYHNPDDPQSLSADAVLSIYETLDGILWVGTDGGGLSRFDRETETFTHFSNDPSDPDSLSQNNVWVIYEDSLDALWIGTDGGLDRFDHVRGAFTHFQNNPDNPQSLSHNSVRAIYEDPSGALWIGTDGGGLDRFERETETFTHFQNDPSDPHSLSHHAVYDIYQDREDVLWIGTRGGGLNKLFLGGLNFAYFNYNPNDPNSLSNNNIRGIYEDQSGTLWVGTNEGLNSFDRTTGQWRHYKHDPEDPFSLSSNIVGDVYEDQEGVLWIGTFDSNGLNSFDPETERFTRYQEDPNDPSSFRGSLVTDIYQDQQGILWIGTFDGGLNRYDRETGSFTHYQSNPNDPDSISSDSIFSIYEDQQGSLWIGTLDSGLNKYDRANEKFAHFKADSQDSSSLSHNFVICIFEDRGGTLWIGTAGGLNKFDRQTKTFTHYREKDGLPNDMVYGILEDGQGNLWLSTNHGLSRFDPRTETFKNFDVNDGLQSNEFNSFAFHKSNSGEMFFGGIGGLNAFYPDRVMDNPTIPPIVLISLTQDGEEGDLGNVVNSMTEVTFKWPDSAFEFEFAALSYARPEKNQYAYMLEGFDENWNEIGTRNYGKYTNLPGGTYTLRLKGSNNDGVWNETGYALDITIVPPFWETWWFRTIVILVMIGGAIGGYGLRVRNLEVRGRELESQVEQRTAELMQIEEDLRQSEMEKAITEERNRLARDLHDSVTQSIYSLTLLAEAGQRMIKSGDIQQAEGNQSRLGDIAQQALQEMRLLVYELRPQVLRSEGLVGALEQRLEAVERRAGINARMLVEVEIELPADLEEELYYISTEALNNALKHTKASEVVLSLRADEGSLLLEVKDNGQGFDQELARSKGGMGLASMGERVEKIGGILSIQSERDVGTSIRVSVPFQTKPQISSVNPEVSQ